MHSVRNQSDVAAVLDAIRRIVRLLRVSARASEVSLDISAAQLFLLQKLAEAPAPSIAELASRALTDPSSVSTVAARLVKRGLVRRTPSPQDGRRAELTLTPAGRRLVQRAPEPAQVRLVEAIERLPVKDRTALARGLTALTRELGITEGVAPLFFEEEKDRHARS